MAPEVAATLTLESLGASPPKLAVGGREQDIRCLGGEKKDKTGAKRGTAGDKLEARPGLPESYHDCLSRLSGGLRGGREIYICTDCAFPQNH